MSDQDELTIAESLEWLRTESTHSGQISHSHKEPPREAEYVSHTACSDPVERALHATGIKKLYIHQAKAVQASSSGDHVVLATETASGKSLPYTMLALERALNHNTTTLYLAPTKALINDQADSIRNLIDKLPTSDQVTVGVYTGDTSKQRRRLIRRDGPDILLMTPEMVNSSLLPWHEQLWDRFLRQLETVVLDEVHVFQGVFGSHVGLVLRRLNRIAAHYNRELSYFCCSATIGNPVEHASNVSGQSSTDFTLVDEDHSGRGRRHWLLYNPPLKESKSPSYHSGSSDDSEYGEYPEDWDQRRHQVYARDGHQCTECGRSGGKGGGAELHAHHIVSPKHGGTHEISNLETLCSKCHSAEHGRPVGREAYGEQQTIHLTESSTADTPEQVQDGYERKSNHPISMRLFTELVARGHQTITFTKARQGAEQYAKASANRLAEMGLEGLAGAVDAYHAALLDDDRQEIEAGLQDGTLRGVWSTNALELGIDIGSLDAAVLDGHPGTNMSLFQQTGRAGRGTDACLLLLVASGNPLDQYCLSNPDAIFEEPPGDAAIDTANKTILYDHLVSAADELPLRVADEAYFGESLSEYVSTLTDKDRLRLDMADGQVEWDTPEEDVQYGMNFRGISDRMFALFDKAREKQIGELTFSDALRDCHPEAIYNQRGRTYQVERFDAVGDRILLREEDTTGFTRPLSDRSISIDEIVSEKPLHDSGSVRIGLADIIYQEQLEGYLQFSHPGDEEPVEKVLDESLPEHQYRTKSLFITVPESVKSRLSSMSKKENSALGAMHAVEHGLRSLYPLEVLCSTNDIGGLSTIQHSDTGAPTIFVFDGIPGGAGLAARGYERIDSLLEKTKKMIDSCECATGCPSCIHLEMCRSGNRILDKRLARVLIDTLL